MEQHKQLTCAERVQGELDREIETLRKLWQAYCDGEEDTEDGSIFEHGLSFDYVPADTFTDQEQGYFRYQISWGGPSDEFRFYTDADKEPYRIEYWFMDWYDGASRTLRGDDRDLLLDLWHWFDEMGSVDSELEKASE